MLKWKMQQEHHRKFHTALETITECLEEAVDDEALLRASASTISGFQHSIQAYLSVKSDKMKPLKTHTKPIQNATCPYN